MIADAVLLVLELVVLFFSVAFAVQLFQRRAGPDRLRSWMGGPPVPAALKGIAIGFLTPFCTYSAIPMLVGLRQAGVPPAGYVAFITAAPVLDPVLFGALALIVGPRAAVMYAAIAFGAALTLALVAQRANIETHLKPLPSQPGPEDPAGRSAMSCAGEPPPWQGLRAESGQSARAAANLLRSVALLLLIGVTIGIGIEAIVTPDDVATITGGNRTLSVPIAAALGTPLYVHTGLFVPIADSLAAAGVGIGAVVALTISGAGANVPEFIILGKLADRRLIAVFFGYVFSVALVGGLLAEVILV